MYQHQPYLDGNILVTPRYRCPSGLWAIGASTLNRGAPRSAGAVSILVAFDAAANDVLHLSRGTTRADVDAICEHHV
jgi:hypothetical protein